MRIKPLKIIIVVKYLTDGIQLTANNEVGYKFLLSALKNAEEVLLSHNKDTGYIIGVSPLKGITNNDVLYHLNEVAFEEHNDLKIRFKNLPLHLSFKQWVGRLGNTRLPQAFIYLQALVILMTLKFPVLGVVLVGLSLTTVVIGIVYWVSEADF